MAALSLMFLMLTISYIEQLKLPRNCLCFWLPCQKTHASVPRHITEQCLVMGGGVRGSIEKWQPKLDCQEFRESTESSLVLINACHEKTWKGTGILSAEYCWDVHIQRTGFWSMSRLLLADLLTEHLFMPLGLAKHYMVLPYH